MTDSPFLERLPAPTGELVKAECLKFDEEPYTKLGEDALRQLREQFPRNTDPAQVLLKVLVLNKLYSTRVNDIDVWPLAQHIVTLNIDDDIRRADLGVIERIYLCENLRMYYSFATKFCSWHNSNAYPIYDRYVDECLWVYQGQDRFADFHRQDLGYYDKLHRIVSAFRTHYGLDQFSFRDIDKFLWRTGAKILAVQ